MTLTSLFVCEASPTPPCILSLLLKLHTTFYQLSPWIWGGMIPELKSFTYTVERKTCRFLVRLCLLAAVGVLVFLEMHRSRKDAHKGNYK